MCKMDFGVGIRLDTLTVIISLFFRMAVEDRPSSSSDCGVSRKLRSLTAVRKAWARDLGNLVIHRDVKGYNRWFSRRMHRASDL